MRRRVETEEISYWQMGSCVFWLYFREGCGGGGVERKVEEGAGLLKSLLVCR